MKSEIQQFELFAQSSEEFTMNAWFPQALKCLGVEERGGWPDLFGDALQEWNRKAKPKQVTAIGLFSGAGGLDIGFHDAGFNIVECNELEPKFAATLLENSLPSGRLHGSKIVCQDIREYTPSVSHADFIIGGPPCQTFSAAGARANGVNGTDDERGNLFMEYARILDHIKPKGFLFENVYRIVGAQGGKPWQRIQDAFRELGYKLHWRIVDAADYGAPQFRERLIIVGLKNGSYQFPFPSHGPDSPDRHAYYTAIQAVHGINTIDNKIGIGGRHGHLLDGIPPGLNYSFYTERMGHPNPLFGWRSKFSDYLYKADPHTPVRTIKAQGGQYTGPFSWENRPFSVDELKRLQTFPDNYTIIGNRQNAIHQLGNSVPPQLARILALSILDQVFGIELPFPIHRMNDSLQLKFRTRKSDLTAVYASKAEEAIARLPKKVEASCKPVRGSIFFTLLPDMRISQTKSKQYEFSCDYVLKKNEWSICLSEKSISCDLDCYSVQIKPPAINSANTPVGNIKFSLTSKSGSSRSLLAMWKVFEHLVRIYAIKDDLVQLFGYYQYKNSFDMNMMLFSESLILSDFWKVVKSVTNGQGVGSVCHSLELVDIYEISQKRLYPILTELKLLGFEIRSHRTNKQIPEEHILIPYSFPTLNERSLQRLTNL